MSSGSLPLATYHRAQSVGEGSFGSVMVVYSDDGEEFAMKLFDNDDDDDNDDEENDGPSGMSVGALREISLLRIFCGENKHANIIDIHDIQTEYVDDDTQAGGGTNGYLGIAMPLFPHGSLANAFKMNLSKRNKVSIAYGLLNAVAYLHAHSIIHRDIKSDNVLLKQGVNNDSDCYEAVLIDFSLAKVLDPSIIIMNSNNNSNNDTTNNYLESTELTHTCEVGTPTYRAPEVVNREPYGLASDLWSVGVVLLELLHGKMLETNRDKSAIRLVLELANKLPPDQPFANLIRGLLQEDPLERWTAQQALESKVFQKFGFTTTSKTHESIKLIQLQDALPLDDGDNDDDDEEEETNDENNNGDDNNEHGKKNKKQTKKKNNNHGGTDKKLVKRYQRIKKICTHMEWDNFYTRQAALNYSIQMSQLDDVDDIDSSQSLLDCIVLAHKFFEVEIRDLHDLQGEKPYFKDWTVEQYVDNESTLFMMLDFCLYPRKIYNDLD